MIEKKRRFGKVKTIKKINESKRLILSYVSQRNTKFVLCVKKEVLKQCVVMYDSRKVRCFENKINKSGKCCFLHD